ncbi:purine nucleoside phosphorylase-like isoform X2 [Dermatophagoides pteronyssinus]|uniref:purine nucleoside phosphorylase-like isoform X2 n=1 Tax=Dermatophagoides pteronyssinus TaxID=6956 RepID=UPI003F66A8AC
MAYIITHEEIDESVKYLQTKVSIKPTIGIICGSGLGGLANLITEPISIEYKDIPHFPVSTVHGHAGTLVFGYLGKAPIVCMKGRIHAYEGYSLARCTFPIRVMKGLGVETLIATNAAGGLNGNFNVTDIMMIKDHIFFPGFSGNNPLRGPNDDRFGIRFPAMNTCYDPKLMKLAENAIEKLQIEKHFRKGVYVMVGGPNFETVAEAKFLRMIGCDAVGMSTVHETMVAHHSGMRVIAFSLITNKIVTDYDSEDKANHEEVLAAAKERSNDFENLIQEIVNNIQNDQIVADN